MIVYGRNAVREALRGRRRVERILATRKAAALDWPAGTPIETVTAEEIARLCGSDDHQGVCAEVEPYPYADPATLLAADDAFVLCLDEVQDPRNLGAICRIAEAAGCSGVVIHERGGADITAVAAKASAGAVEHLPVAKVRNVADWLAEAKAGGAWVYGASADGEPYAGHDYSGRVVLVLGAEGRGLRPRVAKACDALVALPMRGKVDSLNVSAAAAALVYGILHSREGS